METKMRVFVLEDDEARQNWFLKRFFGHAVDIAATVKDGVALLKKNSYDAVFLDHDLTFEHSAGLNHDDGQTGYEVVGYLAQNPTAIKRALVVVHSMNPSGSQRMLNVLRDHGIGAQGVPFSVLPRSLRI